MSINFQKQFSKTLPAIKIFRPSIFCDYRGSIWSSFTKEIQNEIPNELSFTHDKFSKSSKNVLRGIHGDTKSWKLVTCVYGSIQQVVVNYKTGSKNFLKYDSFQINEKNQICVLIPPNYGNAYLVLSKNAIYHYKLAYSGAYIDADKQFSIRWDDPRINIVWKTRKPILSKRDQG